MDKILCVQVNVSKNVLTTENEFVERKSYM